LEKVEHSNWKTLIYVMSFLHSVVLERRKFGPLGWCIPYQFNYSDLEASLLFIERFLNEHLSKLSLHHHSTVLNLKFDVITYMVCNVQYGGRITDDLDRELFFVYGLEFLNEKIFQTDGYCIAEVKLKGPSGKKDDYKSIKYTIP